ncbi:zinc-binding dehydrogenase [Nocardia sp. alder85J]|uniref:zinc-binding dehydrogenase n=1 Tax=Nocardia sp. alder85J TaxID=2862949 RepID=UPI00224F563E|nr:zinc-binding dehydrogenase [Nocardia sp. alder85J]MCX4092938.1 zinc-binding dehydrogenase [Nocardia sp. alder85J]
MATGRDPAKLAEVRALGADTVIDTAVSDAELARAFTAARGTGYDVVLDYLWGRPTEILLRTLVPDSFTFAPPTRLVQVGEAAGPGLTVTAASLRTSGVEIYGAAKGSNAETMAEGYGRIVDWARSGQLVAELDRVPLSDIENAWRRTDSTGRRLVVTP